MVKRNFWQSKKVLITGAEGFISSHLTERLLRLDAQVTVLIRGTSHCGRRVTVGHGRQPPAAPGAGPRPRRLIIVHPNVA